MNSASHFFSVGIGHMNSAMQVIILITVLNTFAIFTSCIASRGLFYISYTPESSRAYSLLPTLKYLYTGSLNVR